MTSKQMIYLCVAIFSSIGSFLPAIWGDSLFSVSSAVFGMIGGLVGVYVGYKMSY